MITTINPSTHVETQPTVAPTMLQSFVDGITGPFTLDAATERMDVTGVRYVAVAYALIGAIVASKVTRSRLASDPEAKPLLAFLF